MKFLDNIKTGAKLIGGFMIVVVIIIAVSILNYFNMKDLNRGTTTLYNDGLKPIINIENAESSLLSMRGDAFKYLAISSQRQDILKTIESEKTTIANYLGEYRKANLSSDQERALGELEDAITNYYKTLDTFISFVDKGENETAIKSASDGGDLSNARKAVGTATKKVIDLTVNKADGEKNSSDSTFATAQFWLIGIALLSIILAIIMGVTITRNIAIPLAQTTGALMKISEGDLLRDSDTTAMVDIPGSKDGSLIKKIESKAREKMLNRKDEIGDISKSL